MRILGIDPGSRITGFGVIEDGAGPCTLAVVASGTLRLGDGPLPERLEKLHVSLAEILAIHQPSAVAVEGIFAKIAPRSALTLGHARGIALLCAAQAKLPVYEYPPALVKRALTHSGGASKLGVARAVGMMLGLRSPLAADAADALAVAICHLSRARINARASDGAPSAWLRALASAPPRRVTRSNALLAAALKGR